MRSSGKYCADWQGSPYLDFNFKFKIWIIKIDKKQNKLTSSQRQRTCTCTPQLIPERLKLYFLIQIFCRINPKLLGIEIVILTLTTSLTVRSSKIRHQSVIHLVHWWSKWWGNRWGKCTSVSTACAVPSSTKWGSSRKQLSVPPEMRNWLLLLLILLLLTVRYSAVSTTLSTIIKMSGNELEMMSNEESATAPSKNYNNSSVLLLHFCEFSSWSFLHKSCLFFFFSFFFFFIRSDLVQKSKQFSNHSLTLGLSKRRGRSLRRRRGRGRRSGSEWLNATGLETGVDEVHDCLHCKVCLLFRRFIDYVSSNSSNNFFYKIAWLL